MRFAHHKVTSLPLSDFVDLMWHAQGYVQPHPSERILPTGSMDLVLSLDASHGDTVSGAHSEFMILDTSRPLSLVGVRFKPGGGFPFFGLPAGELQNSRIPLETLWGGEARRLREQLLEARTAAERFHLLEQALERRLLGVPARDPAVLYALAAFTDPLRTPNVASVVERIGVTQRRFIAAFRDGVGLTPKVFCRITRFRRVIGTLQKAPEVDWAELALDCGYFDQAHFIHDFRDFAGVSPSAYLRQRTSANHVRVMD